MTGFNKVFFDTAPFIFFLEKNPAYYDKVKSFIGIVCQDNVECVTSTITIEEYCVVPYRDNNKALLDQFNDFISETEMDVIEIDESIARKAAQIRAEYKHFKGMDALQLASACVTGCDTFLTNDKQLKQFKELNVVLVDELDI